jgi:nucleoid-associated protein YgaU
MRNDVKLGFAIGGVLLAVLIVYVLVVPGGSSNQGRKVTQGTSTTQPSAVASNTSTSTHRTNTGTTSDAGKVTLEPLVPPVTPPTPSASAAPSTPAVPPPSYTPTPVAATPAAPKVDPFAPKSETAAAPEAVAKAPTAKNDDWNAILNQPPMLMTETPVASTGSRSATATPSTPSAAPAPAATPTTPASSDTYSALTQNSTPPISSEPLSGGSSWSASPTSQPSASAGARTHRVQQGETFASISTAAYGSSKYYPAIMKANPGVDPAHLKVGMTINLPDIASPAVRPTASAAPAAAAPTGDAQRASAKVAAVAPIDATKEYRVQQGDSLYKISLKLYGKSDRANKIFELNKQSMGDDPHHLKVGQVLQLPEPPTQSQTSTASR